MHSCHFFRPTSFQQFILLHLYNNHFKACCSSSETAELLPIKLRSHVYEDNFCPQNDQSLWSLQPLENGFHMNAEIEVKSFSAIALINCHNDCCNHYLHWRVLSIGLLKTWTFFSDRSDHTAKWKLGLSCSFAHQNKSLLLHMITLIKDLTMVPWILGETFNHIQVKAMFVDYHNNLNLSEYSLQQWSVCTCMRTRWYQWANFV